MNKDSYSAYVDLQKLVIGNEAISRKHPISRALQGFSYPLDDLSDEDIELLQSILLQEPYIAAGKSLKPFLVNINKRGRGDKNLEHAKNQALWIRQSNEFVRNAYVNLISTTLSINSMLDLPLELFHKDAISILRDWAIRLGTCGNYIKMYGSVSEEKYKAIPECCRVPLCPWEESRATIRYALRFAAVSHFLPNGIRCFDLKKNIIKRGVPISSTLKSLHPFAVLGWKMISLNPKGTGDLIQDMKKIFKLRTSLMRYLKSMNVLAAIAGIDVGPEDGHVHLHILAYGPYLNKPKLERWLRNQDCTVPGCSHKANDRCDKCKKDNCECNHPDGDRPRCNGSWHIDIRASKDLIRNFIYLNDLKTRTAVTEEGMQLHLAVHLLTYNKNRVQNYGYCRPQAWPEGLLDDYIRQIIPRENDEYIYIGWGKWNGKEYEWYLSTVEDQVFGTDWQRQSGRPLGLLRSRDGPRA